MYLDSHVYIYIEVVNPSLQLPMVLQVIGARGFARLSELGAEDLSQVAEATRLLSDPPEKPGGGGDGSVK